MRSTFLGVASLLCYPDAWSSSGMDYLSLQASGRLSSCLGLLPITLIRTSANASPCHDPFYLSPLCLWRYPFSLRTRSLCPSPPKRFGAPASKIRTLLVRSTWPLLMIAMLCSALCSMLLRSAFRPSVLLRLCSFWSPCILQNPCLRSWLSATLFLGACSRTSQSFWARYLATLLNASTSPLRGPAMCLQGYIEAYWASGRPCAM